MGEETGNIRLVLSDGCIIDDEDVFLQLESNELYVLKADEVLNIPQALSTASGGSEAGTCDVFQICIKSYLPKSKTCLGKSVAMHAFLNVYFKNSQ